MRSHKQPLRDTAKARRLRMSTEKIRDASALIMTQLNSFINWGDVRTLHCYIANEAMKEPLTLPFLSELKRSSPSLSIYLPRIADNELESVLFTQETALTLNRYQIPEPTSPADTPAALDVIIVPTLVFDVQGNRLGYGKGYYDRFLNRYPGAYTIGLAYEADKVSAVPVEPHDQKLDMIVTEEAVYTILANKFQQHSGSETNQHN